MPKSSPVTTNIDGVSSDVQSKFEKRYNKIKRNSCNGTSTELGRKGEQVAVDFLKHNGYKIVEINFRTKIAQIDIIAKDKHTVCFVEVKMRRTTRFGHPYEAVGVLKQSRISRAALIYLKQNKLVDSPARFDVVSILYNDKQPKIELIKNAFELDCRYLC